MINMGSRGSSGGTIKGQYMIKEAKVYTSMPKGWTLTSGALTAPKGYEWISNNKSRFSGQRELGLLKIKNKRGKK